jgi:hypothetical protein
MTDDRITAYLLQELTEEEAERFEEQCFAQEEWPAELDSAEQELIDAYLQKELSKDRRRRFEKHYLTTDARKARVLTAQSFHQVLCPVPRQKVTLREKLQAFWQRPLIPQSALALLVLAISASLLVPLLRERQSPQTFKHLDLAMSSSDRTPGPHTQKVTLPLGADALKIHLELPEQSPDAVGYRVKWQTVNENLGELKIESQDAEYVIVVIPATSLSPGQYALKLFTINRDGRTNESVSGNYYFTAEEAVRSR